VFLVYAGGVSLKEKRQAAHELASNGTKPVGSHRVSRETGTGTGTETAETAEAAETAETAETAESSGERSLAYTGGCLRVHTGTGWAVVT